MSLNHMTTSEADAYRAGFAEAQRRIAAQAMLLAGDAPPQGPSAPFARGAWKACTALALSIPEMVPEGPAR